MGPKACQDTLRTALAVGADSAMHIDTGDMRTDQELQPLAVAKVLAWVSKEKKPDAWILGKQSIDDDSNQTGQMLAGLLDWPQATFASKIVVSDDKKTATVTREADGGSQTIRVPLPAVLTADLRLNQLGPPSLQNIIKAKKKPIDIIAASTTGVDLKPKITVVSVAEPAARQAGKVVKNVDELLSKLRNEAGVL